MLFHVTLRHSPVDCPGRNPDKARASRIHFAEREARQRELGYQIRAFVGAWPSHFEYALMEAPELATVRSWTKSFPNGDAATIKRVRWMAHLITEDQAVTPNRTEPGQGGAALFHLTMDHDHQHCPTKNADIKQALRERHERREQRSKETGAKVQFFVSAEPSHLSYALIEANSVESVRLWLMRYPVPQDVTVTPVQPMSVLLSRG